MPTTTNIHLFDLVPLAPHGVIRIGADCLYCHKPTPILGARGKGRPMHLWPKDYWCHEHALRVDEHFSYDQHGRPTPLLP